MRELPNVEPGRLGVFTCEDARAAGWTASALRHAVRVGRIVRLTHAVYAPREDSDGPAERRAEIVRSAIAGTLTTPGSVVSHLAAACLAGVPTLSIPARACVTVPPRHTGDAESVHLHRARLDSTDITRSAGIPRTSTARTIVDIAREHGVDESVVVGDAALRRGLTSPADINRVLTACALWPGIRRARASVPLLDPRAESALESVSRLRILRLGRPAPELQVDLTDDLGFWMARVDFYWPALRVVGEADGMDKYATAPVQAFRAEKRRQERLEDAGLIVVRWGWPEIARPELLCRKLDIAFARAAARGSWRGAVAG